MWPAKPKELPTAGLQARVDGRTQWQKQAAILNFIV